MAPLSFALGLLAGTFVLEIKTGSYSRSYMSDAKWRKLFSVVNQEALEIQSCLWKLVNEATPKNGYVPDIKQLGETYVGDCGALNGPFPFREIEWLLLPRKHEWRPYQGAPPQVMFQDVEAISRSIQAIGQFEVELSDEGLRVYGYKP